MLYFLFYVYSVLCLFSVLVQVQLFEVENKNTDRNTIIVSGKSIAFETLACRYRYFVTFLKLPSKCTSLQVKVVLK